jgi:UPF0755 protein
MVLGPGPAAPHGDSTDVVVPAGGGLAGVARSLEAAGVVRSRFAIMAAALASGSAHRLKAGEYDFRSRESLIDILSALRRGLVVRRFITIPEGFTSREVSATLRGTDYLTGPAPVAPEGSLLPETYEAHRGEAREAVLARMAAARDRLLDELWAARAPGLPFATPEQAVTLASVVEKETGRPDERPRVAAVFINRLRKGMRLESDPTVIYGLSGGAPLGHPLTTAEVTSSSAYNTYLIGGLPPTPIANPGRAALAAALNPARTGDLYFVADGTGGHRFAETFDDHKRNVAHWRAVEQVRKRGRA